MYLINYRNKTQDAPITIPVVFSDQDAQDMYTSESDKLYAILKAISEVNFVSLEYLHIKWFDNAFVYVLRMTLPQFDRAFPGRLPSSVKNRSFLQEVGEYPIVQLLSFSEEEATSFKNVGKASWHVFTRFMSEAYKADTEFFQKTDPFKIIDETERYISLCAEYCRSTYDAFVAQYFADSNPGAVANDEVVVVTGT